MWRCGREKTRSNYIGMKINLIGPQVITCLSIGERALKLAQSKEERAIRTIFSLKAAFLSDKSDEELMKALPELLKGQRQKDLGRFIIMIPRQSAAFDIVKLPSVKPDEIREMSRLQAAKLLPYEPHSIIVGCQPIRVTPEGFTEAALIIIHQDIIKRYLKILEKNKLEPQEIAIDSQGICSWLKLQKSGMQEMPQAVIDLDSYSARIDIISQGASVYSRAFALYLPLEEYKIRLSDEINRSLSAYEKENIGERPLRAFFTGAGNLLSCIDEDFISRFNFECVKCPQDENMLFKTISAQGLPELRESSFASVLGMALEVEKPSFNLLPEEMVVKRQKAAIQSQARKAAWLISLIAATAALAMFLNIFEKKRIIKQLNIRLAGLSQEAGRIEKISRKVKLVKDQIKSQPYSSLEVLTEVFRIASEGITLSSFSYESGDYLSLKGQGRALAEVFSFVNGLEASGLFKNVQVRHSSKRKIRNEEVADFEIACPIEKR